MNRYQRAYDSYDKTNKLLKLTNSFYHFRNLEFIKKRKPTMYSKDKIVLKRNKIEPFNDFFVIKENEGLKKKIKNIKSRPVKAQINNTYLEKEAKLKDFHSQIKNLEIKKRKQENDYYKSKVNNQKSIIDTRKIEKDYDSNLKRYCDKLRKLGPGENVVLPLIKNTRDNPMLLETKKYYNTEASKNEDYEGGSSKGRSKECSEQNGDEYYASKNQNTNEEENNRGSEEINEEN